MIRLHRSTRTTRAGRITPASVIAIGLATVLLAACSAAVGPLGTPASPQPSAPESVALPSSDATPDLSSPEASPSTSAGPSATPGASAPASSAGSTTPPTARPTATPTPGATPAATTIVRNYYVLGSFTDNAGLAPVLREVPSTKAVATAAMRTLLQGPNAAEMAARPAMYTTIPTGTTLLGLSIGDGIATVNLSREFESGGGSASVLGRLAQVVYTLTQFPTVTGVRFQLDGVPVTVFGGEGVVLDHPVTREDYRDQLPAIFVDRPAWGASLGNPGTVSGLANVFEATFRVALLDAAGRTLADRQVTASCGTGCWGTFATSIPYSVSKTQWGTLRVYDSSAKDGSTEHVTEYPVWLTPGG